MPADGVVMSTGGPPADGETLTGAAPAGRRRRRLLLLAVGVAVLTLALITADGHQRRHEVAQLLDRATSGRAAVDYADGRIRSVVAYSSPALLSGDVDPAVRAGLRDLVRQEAADRVPHLQDERRAASAVRVLPWHTAQREARASWLAYLDVRLAYVSGISTDFAQLFRQHPELAAALTSARVAYARAAPDDAPRVAELFAGT